MQIDTIRNTIISKFNQKTLLQNIDAEQDFFDLGASSLTIVDLQLQIEEVIGLCVTTGELMINPTLNGWIDLYSKQESHEQKI